MTAAGIGMGEDWADAFTTPSPPPPARTASLAAAPETDEVERHFPGLEEWVVQWLSPTVRRQHNENTFRWCPKWWAHAEAISRLNGLWEGWENARLEGAVAMLGWWQVFDHHLAVLTSPAGPFAQCLQTGHRSDGQPLHTVAAPPGTWDEDDAPA